MPRLRYHLATETTRRRLASTRTWRAMMPSARRRSSASRCLSRARWRAPAPGGALARPLLELLEVTGSGYAPLDAAGQSDLLLAGKEAHLADLFQIRPHRVRAARSGGTDLELEAGHR